MGLSKTSVIFVKFLPPYLFTSWPLSASIIFHLAPPFSPFFHLGSRGFARGSLPPASGLCTIETLYRVFSKGQPTFRNIPRSVRLVWAELLPVALTDVVSTNSVEAWVRLLLLPTCLLGIHGLHLEGGDCVGQPSGRGRATASHNLIRRRAELWSSGHYDDVIHELLMAPSPSLFRSGPLNGEDRVRDKVTRLVSEGHFGAAVRHLQPGAVAPFMASTADAVQTLFPPRDPLEVFDGEDITSPPLFCSRGDVVGALRTFKVGTAYARDGLRVRHLLDVFGPPAHGAGSLVLDGLTSLLNAVFRGAMPAGIRPFWVGGAVTPLLKPQGGLRPIAVGSIFRRLASKIAVRAAPPAVGPYLRPLQVGVGVRGGARPLSTRSTGWLRPVRTIIPCPFCNLIL
eukprot:jgi/Botrbrau1/10156/Bobra.0121s0008.1